MYINNFAYHPYNISQAFCPFFNSAYRNKIQNFSSFEGTVIRIEDLDQNTNDSSAGCYKLIYLETKDRGPVNFVVSPDTYFVDYETIEAGDTITAFYDANAPVILIYPPQYQAIIISKETEYQNVIVDYFDNQLINSNKTLKLNLAPSTETILKNNQPFNRYPGARNLIVVYGPTTKSIPAQTTPYRIIVMC